MGGRAKVVCKYYAILYKGLENPWILVSTGVLESIPCRYQGPTKLENQFPLFSSFSQISVHSFNKFWRSTTCKAIFYCNRIFLWRQTPHNSTSLSSFPYPCLCEAGTFPKACTKPKERELFQNNLTGKTGPKCFSQVLFHYRSRKFLLAASTQVIVTKISLISMLIVMMILVWIVKTDWCPYITAEVSLW